MPPTNYDKISSLLESWGNGNTQAVDELLPLVYDELKQMAKRYMNTQPSGHTLQTTALIHEAYLKIVDNSEKHWQNKTHFFGVAAQAMRHILVDRVRSHQTEKRGGGNEIVSLEETAEISLERADELIALDEALKSLSKLDQRKSQVVELRYFGGLSVEETAEFLNVSRQTVIRDWNFAKMWLLRELSNQ